MCVLSHFRTCDVRAEVRAERYFELCVRSACVWLVLDVRCAIALLHTFLKKMTRFSVLEHPFSNLEHLFLFWNILSCFRMSYFFGTPYFFWKFAEIISKNYKRCGCEVRPPQIEGAHTCVCVPKSGRARCVRATQKTVTTHTLLFSWVKHLVHVII